MTRPPAAVIAAALGALCPACPADAAECCWPGPGVHLIRVAVACRSGLISGAEFLSVTGCLPFFTAYTAVAAGPAGEVPG